MEVRFRRAARVLLLDDSDRLLMLHATDPARAGHHYWMTVGGGMRDGESLAECAAREVAEETGLLLSPRRLGPVLWHEVSEFPFGAVWYRQAQDYFLVRVPAFQVDTDGFDDLERATVDRYRWWTMAELQSTGERFYPVDLVERLKWALSNDTPDARDGQGAGAVGGKSVGSAAGGSPAPGVDSTVEAVGE